MHTLGCVRAMKIHYSTQLASSGIAGATATEVLDCSWLSEARYLVEGHLVPEQAS